MQTGGKRISATSALPLTGLDYHRTAHRVPERPLQGVDALANWLVGKYRRRGSRLQQLQEQAEIIDSLSPQFSSLSNHQLQERLFEFRSHFRREPSPEDEILNQALAAIREAAHRQVGLRAFPVQLIGALALHHGWLAEMATGEGKTLTAGIAGVLAGWTKRPTKGTSPSPKWKAWVSVSGCG